MIALCAVWGVEALIVGLLSGHEIFVGGLILIAMAAAGWVVRSLRDGYVQNANASAMLAESEARRAERGSL